MKDETNTIADDPKAALAGYINELKEEYCKWYDTASDRNYKMWAVAQAVTVVAGVGSSLLAALMSEQQFRDYGWLRVALIVTPLIGTLASTFLIQTRVRDLLALREFGREAFQTLESRARAEFAAATKPEDFTKIHRDLIACVSRIEKEQTVGFFSVVPEMGAHARNQIAQSQQKATEERSQ